MRNVIYWSLSAPALLFTFPNFPLRALVIERMKLDWVEWNADLPDGGPVITGSRPRYKVILSRIAGQTAGTQPGNFSHNSVMLLAAPQTGDTIAANCSSHNSVPAAVLHWYVNGEEATGSMVTEYPVVADSTGLRTSVLGLRYANTPPHPTPPLCLDSDSPFRRQVKDKMFGESGDIKIKCTATIHTIYWRSNEESIQGIQERSLFNYELDNSRFWNSGKMFIFINIYSHYAASQCWGVNYWKYRYLD